MLQSPVWKIEYFSDRVSKDIFGLPAGQLARYLHYTDLMEQYGANLGMPHTRALGDGLFEIRLKGPEGISRVLYCTLLEKRIVMLHSFVKKTQKIPAGELEVARRRMQKAKK